MFEKRRKRKALQSYLEVLPKALIKRYGGSETYSKGQLSRTIEEEGFNSQYYDYSAALFFDDNDSIEVVGSKEKVDELIKEIADLFFEGNTDFKSIFRKRTTGNDGAANNGDYPVD